MSNLEKKKKKNDVSIAINGEGFISQSKCAELLGLNQSTISRWVKVNAYLNSVNNNNQLNEDLFQNLVKTHRLKGNKNANDLTDMFIKAGIRAYVYSVAGITNTPDRVQIEKLESDLAEEKKKVKVKTIGVGSQVNRRSLHEQREQLFTDGMCNKWTEEVKHYYYPVNARGKEMGYTNAGVGKRKTINLEK